MDFDSDNVVAQDVGVDSAPLNSAGVRAPLGAPNWRVLLIVGLAIAALLGVYTLGQSSEPAPVASPPVPTATAIPSTPVPEPTATSIPEPPPELVDFLGEGVVLAELELSSRSRAIIWCRESVPGTQISSTLALIQIATSIRFGDQVVLYEELTKPWLPGGSFRRGLTLQTEGLGAGNFASTPETEDVDEAERSDGEQCERCAPNRVTVAGGDVLVGSCAHGIPFRAGIVYVIAPPVRPGQTPLALHVDCGITAARVEDDRLVVEAEVPLLRGLHDARFPLPTINFERTGGRFVASDLGLLDWNCDIERSSQLFDRHLLRTEAVRSISYERTESAIGEIGVHGPMVLGLTADQCSLMTRAWWGQEGLDEPAETPIADLVGLEPPAGEQDWFYGCDR